MGPALRLLGFFGLAWVALLALQQVPGIGGFFRGFFGFWVVLIGLSVGLERLASAGLRRRRFEAEARALGNVESPHNQGKLGSLFLAAGRAREALEPLRRAAAGEPASAEWQYRLGQALAARGEHAEAALALERATEIDEEHAFGAALLALSAARLELGETGRAIDCAERFERNHGPSPESAYRRGLAYKREGRRGEAARAFDGVVELAKRSARYQRRDSNRWALRARLARLG